MNQKHDKEKVVQTGLRLFCSKGYHHVGLDEICKSTGMTKGAFYNAFESKENFLLETLESIDRSNVEKIHRVLAPDAKTKAIDRLEQFYLDMLNHQPKVNYMGCMISNTMSELGAQNERVGKATAEGFEHIINAIEPAVKLAQEEGDLRMDFDSKEIAALLHSTFYGVLTRAKSLGNCEKGIRTMELLFSHLKK